MAAKRASTAPTKTTRTAAKPAARKTTRAATASKAATGGTRAAAGGTRAGTGSTVTLKHIAAEIASSHEMPKRQADEMLGDVVDIVVKHLKKGDRIRIGGLGILQVKKRAARMGRKPATGEAIKIKASKKVAFRASKELKESI